MYAESVTTPLREGEKTVRPSRTGRKPVPQGVVFRKLLGIASVETMVITALYTIHGVNMVADFMKQYVLQRELPKSVR